MRRRAGKTRKRPLAGKRVVITRRREQAGALRDALVAKGARVLALPTIAIQPPRSWQPLDKAIRRLPSYDWLLFTSANGVESFFRRLRRQRNSVRTLAGHQVAAIGPATEKALRNRGVRADVVPDEFRAEGLLRALGPAGWRGRRVLLARAAKAREVLPRVLRRRGALVTVVPAYETVVPRASRRLAKKIFSGQKPDAVTFTSSSTVQNFAALVGRARLRRVLNGVAVASIGPVTSRTARRLGLPVAIEARRYTIPGLVQALEDFFRKSARAKAR